MKDLKTGTPKGQNSRKSDLKQFINTSLVDLVAKQIRSMIFAGDYLPGEKLVVRELSEVLGVSHTPVKDALNRLVSEDLVEAIPNKSMVVKSFTNNELVERLGVRLMCELFYAGEIIRSARKDDTLVVDLEACLTAMEEAISDDTSIDYEAWVSNETRFHRRYMMAAQNQSLVTVYNGLNTNEFTFFAYLHNEHKPLKRPIFENNLVEHREIIEALKALDQARFVKAIAWHVLHACEDYNVDEEAKLRIDQIKRLAECHLDGLGKPSQKIS
nr:GntR family transcriptional regulator [uncultured Cohaesibacter sp.]